MTMVEFNESTDMKKRRDMAVRSAARRRPKGRPGMQELLPVTFPPGAPAEPAFGARQALWNSAPPSPPASPAAREESQTRVRTRRTLADGHGRFEASRVVASKVTRKTPARQHLTDDDQVPIMDVAPRHRAQHVVGNDPNVTRTAASGRKLQRERRFYDHADISFPRQAFLSGRAEMRQKDSYIDPAGQTCQGRKRRGARTFPDYLPHSEQKDFKAADNGVAHDRVPPWNSVVYCGRCDADPWKYVAPGTIQFDPARDDLPPFRPTGNRWECFRSGWRMGKKGIDDEIVEAGRERVNAYATRAWPTVNRRLSGVPRHAIVPGALPDAWPAHDGPRARGAPPHTGARKITGRRRPRPEMLR